MVELIVVILLVGILGAVGAARFSDKATFDSAGYATRAASALRYAQKEAIAQNRPVTVLLDAAGISLCFSAASPCPTPVIAPFSSATDSYCTSAKAYCLSRPSAVTYTSSLGVPSSMTFDAAGRPSSGGANTTAAVALTVTSGSSSTVVTVEPETGYVH